MAGLNPVLTLLLSVAVANAGFAPNVNVDNGRSCGSASITLGPRRGEYQPVYVVMGDGQNVVFQKSTDAGRTWLAENQVVCQGGASDVATDLDGNVYIACGVDDSTHTSHVYCVRSTDGGATWSAPARIDDNPTEVSARSGHLAADAAGNLFCAWEDARAGVSRIWSSVSTDRGTTWRPSVRVCDDTIDDGCGDVDVFVQPVTNHYLVAATGPFELGPGWISAHAYFYRSSDTGRTFEPGVQLDSSDYAASPHVVADAQHIICDYNCDHGGSNLLTEARTLFPCDTWGPCRPVTDPSYNSYLCSALAISADGRIHTALMMNYRDGRYDACYAYSTDHGATWSRHERVNDDTTGDEFYPAIAADSAGHAYLVWEDGRQISPGIWFSTNNWSPNAEHPPQPSSFQPLASIVRGVLLLPRPVPATFSLLTSAGRKALELRSGANDVSRLSPGVYFVRDARARIQSASKVVITR